MGLKFGLNKMEGKRSDDKVRVELFWKLLG